MKKLTFIAAAILFVTVSAFAQNAEEQEILRIHKSLDEAFLKKDVTAFERIFAEDYVMSSTTGKMMSRAEVLEDLRKEMAGTEYKMLTAATDNLKVRVSGSMAFVTGNWSTASVPASDTNAEPHKDAGRYTGIYERRDGKWLLVAEHWSEAPHDRKLMEQQVLKAAQESNNIYKNRDYTAMERLVADDAIFIDTKGNVKTRTEVLAELKNSQVKLESIEITEQKVRVIGNASAIETGLVRYKGTDKNGKSFDETERYTTTWVWRTGRWQIVADHVSSVKK